MPNSLSAVPLRPALAACIALPIAFVESASACSVCLAGDPSSRRTGRARGEVGQWNLFIQGSGWKKESAALPEDQPPGEGGAEGGAPPTEKNQSQRLDLYLGYTPLDRLTLTLNVPFAFNHITEIEGDERQKFSLSGLGDVSLLTSFVLWRDRDVLPGTWVEGRAFLKAPTGKSHERVDGVQDPHLQPGTGSWDFGFGLAAAHQLNSASLYRARAFA